MNDVENASLVPPFLTDGSAVNHQPVTSASYCPAGQSTFTVLSQTGGKLNPQPLSMRLTPCSGPQTYPGITSFHVATVQMKPASCSLPGTDDPAYETPAAAPLLTKGPAGKASDTATMTRASVAVEASAFLASGAGSKTILSVIVKTPVLPALTVSPLALKLVSESLTPLPLKTLVKKCPTSPSTTTTTQVRKSIVLIPRRTEVKQPQQQVVTSPVSAELIAPPPKPADSPPQDLDPGGGLPPDLVCPLSPRVSMEEEESPQMPNEKKGKKGLMVWAKGLGPAGPVLMKRSSVFKYKPKVVEANRRTPYPGYTKIRLSPLEPEPQGGSVAETATEKAPDTTEKNASTTSSSSSSEGSGNESLIQPGGGNLRLVGFLMPSQFLHTGESKGTQAPTVQPEGGGPSQSLQPDQGGPTTTTATPQLNPSEEEQPQVQENQQTSEEPCDAGLPGDAPFVNSTSLLALYAPAQATAQEPHEPMRSSQPGEGEVAQKTHRIPSVKQGPNVGYLIPVQSLESVPLVLPAPCKGPNDADALPSARPTPTARGSDGNARRLFRCKTCLASFSDREHLSRHVNAPPPCHRCHRCRLNFATAPELSRHRLAHKTKQRRRCEYCARVCANAKSLRLHEKRWHPAALAHDRDNCSVCKTVLTRTKLREHLQVDKNFYCLECYGCFYTSKELDAHIERSHGVWTPPRGEKRKQPEPAAVGGKPRGQKRKPRRLVALQEPEDPMTLFVTSQSLCELTALSMTSQSPSDLTTLSMTSQSPCDLTSLFVTSQPPLRLRSPPLTLQPPSVTSQPSL